MSETERFRGASARFKTFFTELNDVFVERQALLVQIALGLLGREHVLVTGPPGTAKSQIAAASLGRIVDELTGAPSLYARQFTENTVHTDLVGPIDFKTLMESGRTEHFTDEGMLGAVHAFLDEVFDGRDMLLRSALNVLNERELKQGTRTTKGRIECAVMTSNRYLAEILEGSRETLLAFVDRIAFVSFVPKGFAEPENLAAVVRRQAGGAGPRRLESTLTVQDLDALQEMTDRVRMSDGACDALVKFVQQLDAELASAAKADPDFVPTRYLSTRTVVRCAKVLRAACVFDKIFLDPARSFDVLPKDFSQLWTHLILAGPTSAEAQKLLQRETDPRERRQLEIVRTEREIFDRCLAKAPAFQTDPAPMPVDTVALRETLKTAVASADPAALGHAARLLARVAAQAGPDAPDAAELLDEGLDQLRRRALRAGLTAGVGGELKSEVVVGEICAVADEVEQTSSSLRPVARWLRGRALTYLESVLALVPAVASDLEALTSESVSGEAILQAADHRVTSLRKVAELRQSLVARGAALDDAEASSGTWRRIVSRAEDDLSALWDAAFRREVANAMRETSSPGLSGVLERVRAPLERIRRGAGTLAAIAGTGEPVEARVIGPRLAPLVAAAFTRLDALDRIGVIAEIERLLAQLEDARVSKLLDATDVVRWTAEALVRASSGTAASLPSVATFDEYRAFRAGEQRVPLLYVIVEVALRFLDPSLPNREAASGAAGGMRDVMQRVPPETRRRVVESEVRRIERTVTVIERWWDTMMNTGGRSVAQLDALTAKTLITTLAASKFLDVARDEAALARLALEARLLRELIPDEAAPADALRERIEKLDARVHDTVRALSSRCADEAWAATLAPRARGA